MMKATRSGRGGSAGRLVPTEVPRPEPEDHEVLIRVHASTVTRGDVILRKMPALVARLVGEAPKTISGSEFAGEVVAVGDGVTTFEPGDRVFGTTDGLARGSHAEFVCVPESGVLATMPPHVSHREAAATPVAAMTALHFLTDARVGSADRVLINGASGSVGSVAVQIARDLGAHVTGVCGTANIDLVASLGADEVIDYTMEDFTEGNATYDVVFDAAGKTTRRRAVRVLTRDGRFVTTRSRRRDTVDELRIVGNLMARGAIEALIDRSYTLDEIGDAYRYVETGQKRGNVIIEVVAPDRTAG